MTTEPELPRPTPWQPPRVREVEDAATVTHREFVEALRAIGRWALDTADVIEAEPFNDAMMATRGAHAVALDHHAKALAERFIHARVCTGGIQ